MTPDPATRVVADDADHGCLGASGRGRGCGPDPSRTPGPDRWCRR